MQLKKNTLISYLYRDADNYKNYISVIVKGTLSENAVTKIISSLNEGEYFIPQQVGLPETRFPDGITEADHIWFELYESGICSTSDDPTINLSADDVLRAFVNAAENWNEADAIERLNEQVH